VDTYTPRISIALATYNGARYLSQLLDSIEQQTTAPFEIVACDDGSQDQTVSILKEYRLRLPITVLENKQSIGVVQNFKKVVANCTGEYIAFCDQDDVWQPDKLTKSVRELNTIDGPWPAMVFTDLCVVDEDLNKIADSYWQHRKLNPTKETFNSLIYGNFVTGCTMVVNKRMAIELQDMPDKVLMHDFWIACIAYGLGKHSFVDQPTIFYRQHSSNVTDNSVINWAARWQRLKALLLDPGYAGLFLLPEIAQAQLYLTTYKQRLSLTSINDLNQLILLKDKLPIVRKWHTFWIKFMHFHH
jgi:glycosyltransferase involved in cell wall biosynthesis